MKSYSILPVIIMIESFAAGAVLLCCRKWGSGVYWIAAGLLNLAVCFLVKKFG
jgi:hypothetical protein